MILKKAAAISVQAFTPLTAIHLHSNKTGRTEQPAQAEWLYIFSGIALMILLIACVNFMNLSTARSLQPGKGSRCKKSVGLTSKNLVQQFLTESFLISFIALIVLRVHCRFLTPLFQPAFGEVISMHLLYCNQPCYCCRWLYHADR